MTTAPATAIRRTRRAVDGSRRWSPTALLVELVSWFVISAGTFTHWHYYLAFLNDLAEGFRQRHLHLAVEPPAALLARPNPFDPANAGPLVLGRQPLPAATTTSTGGPSRRSCWRWSRPSFGSRRVVGDEPVVFWLATLQLVAGTLVHRAGGAAPLRSAAAGAGGRRVLVLGLANPTLYNLARPAVYEAAIVGGQAFLLLGLVFAFDAIGDRRRAAPGGWSRPAPAWAAAFGCRISLGAGRRAARGGDGAGLAPPASRDRWRRLRAVGALARPAGGARALRLFCSTTGCGSTPGSSSGAATSSAGSTCGVGQRFIAAEPLRLPAPAAGLSPAGSRSPTRSWTWARAPSRPGTSCRRATSSTSRWPGVLPALPWSWLAPVALVGTARSIWRTRAVSPVQLGRRGDRASPPPRRWPRASSSRPPPTATSATSSGGVALLGALGVFAALRGAARRAGAPQAGRRGGAPAGHRHRSAWGSRSGSRGSTRTSRPTTRRSTRSSSGGFSVCHGEIPPEPK